ncbi:MAG: serine/threonine protein kinase [Myxococcales bacterium]|nr:serine/threonine protein kinase [Myxococcales bacterium]
MDPLLGLTVAGRYRIDRRIGVGGMGTVYLGTHVRVGQRVAVKVLHERYAGDRALTQRFENEALTYARVSHPNLVALHDFGRTPDGCYFMVLEYCPGTALARLVRRHERLDPTLVVEVIIQVAQGLGAAHAAGIVHRDLKPENVMLVEAGPGRYHVKLLDFGIAKRLDDDGPRLTQAGMVFGTPEYMAPEQARGERVDGRSDIYALGCLLYELLTGDPPFVGSNKLQVMHRQASEKPRPPSEGVAGIPPALEAITLKCLEKRPADRFSSTDEFIAALEHAFGTERPTPVPPPVRLRETRVPAQARGVEADTALTITDDRDQPTSLPTERVLIDHTPPPRTTVVPPDRSALFIVGGIFVAAVALAAWLFGADDAVDAPEVNRVVTAAPATQEDATRPPPDAALPDAAPPTAAPPSAPPTAPPTEAPPTAPPAPPPTVASPRTAERVVDDARRKRRERAEQARRLEDAQTELSRGRLDRARKQVEEVLSQDARHREARALLARIDDLESRIRQGTEAYARNDCPAALAALRPVQKVSPSARVLTMVSDCAAGMPPRKMADLR